MTPTLRTAILIAALTAMGLGTVPGKETARTTPVTDDSERELVPDDGAVPPAEERGTPPPGAAHPGRSPAQLFSTTVPGGVFRYRLFSEYWSEDFDYVRDDLTGSARDFRAETFFEVTSEVAVSYGFTDHWELGVALPVATSFFERDVDDGFGGVGRETSGSALGNVRILVSNGHTWHDGAENLLFELEVGLPTDRRDGLLGVGGDASLAVTGEHYWEFYGLIGVVEGNYYAASGFSDGEWSVDYLAGVGLDLSRRWYATVLAGEADGTPRVEVEGEFFNSSTTSVKLFAGQDVNGAPHARFIGVGLTYLIGGPRAADHWWGSSGSH